jgi:hypothetical protein
MKQSPTLADRATRLFSCTLAVTWVNMRFASRLGRFPFHSEIHQVSPVQVDLIVEPEHGPVGHDLQRCLSLGTLDLDFYPRDHRPSRPGVLPRTAFIGLSSISSSSTWPHKVLNASGGSLAGGNDGWCGIADLEPDSALDGPSPAERARTTPSLRGASASRRQCPTKTSSPGFLPQSVHLDPSLDSMGGAARRGNVIIVVKRMRSCRLRFVKR